MQKRKKNFERFALYYVPSDSELTRFGVSWLGWDMETGVRVPHPDLPLPVDEITETPRRYGLHATVVPPFRIHLPSAEKMWRLVHSVGAFCNICEPVATDGLDLVRLGRFLALMPVGDTSALRDLASGAVEACDTLRAPLSDADLERHRAKGLTPEQDALLVRWGYPYVMEEFRFHITLTSKLPKAQGAEVKEVLQPVLAPLLPRPFVVDALTLVGEDEDGWFHLIKRFPLGAGSAL